MRILHKFFKISRSQPENGFFYDKITHIIGDKPADIQNFKRAFTHRSMNLTDAQGHPLNYERLEFLGDAMLGSVIASHLYRQVPNGDEGYLTKMRSKIVSRENLNELGRSLNLIELVESKIGNQQFGENIYGNLLEALIGAIYLDKGYPACIKFIHEKILKKEVDIQRLETKITSYKSLLIEWCQKKKYSFKFESFEEESCEDVRYFGVKLYINDKIVGRARGTSKKKAEEKAAQRAYFALQEKIISGEK